MKKYLTFILFLFVMSCAHQEPKDLSLLNNPALDLTKKFKSESASSASGLRAFGSQTGNSGCSVCAH